MITIVAQAQNSLSSFLSQMVPNVEMKLATSSHVPFQKTSHSLFRFSQMDRQVIKLGIKDKN